MAEIINAFQSSKGRPPKYPWTAADASRLSQDQWWSDGQARRLSRGVDFDADLVSFRTMVHRKARDLGLAAYTHINLADSSISVQFYAKD